MPACSSWPVRLAIEASSLTHCGAARRMSGQAVIEPVSMDDFLQACSPLSPCLKVQLPP